MSVPCYACHQQDPACCAVQAGAPFAILGVDPTLRLGEDVLEAAFHHRIRQVHPDVITQTKALPAIQPEVLNQAYQDLRAPYTRALALYKRATGQTVPMVTKDPEVLAWALDLEDATPEDRRALQRRLWETLLSMEDAKNWAEFLKALLQYRYGQEKA